MFWLRNCLTNCEYLEKYNRIKKTVYIENMLNMLEYIFCQGFVINRKFKLYLKM